jgi:hypothetical protein
MLNFSKRLIISTFTLVLYNQFIFAQTANFVSETLSTPHALRTIIVKDQTQKSWQIL